MRGTLLLAILSVKSSYSREVEEQLESDEDVPDTLQWWISANGSWRIKTYALDHDIHTHSIGGDRPDLLEVAKANNAKHYGDVIREQYVLELEDCTNQSEVQRSFAAIDLEPRLEVAPGRFAFWKPDDAKYRSQSTPK